MHCRRVTEAVQDRDVRLADLQSKIEQLSRAKERAVQDNGSEVASLEVKLVGFIKDNSELLRANKWVSLAVGGLLLMMMVVYVAVRSLLLHLSAVARCSDIYCIFLILKSYLLLSPPGTYFCFLSRVRVVSLF